MSALPPDIWVNLVPLFRPRELYLLMCTNKGLLKAVKENKKYWTRVAAQVVWREIAGLHCYMPKHHYECFDFKFYAEEDKGFDRFTLYYNINLPVAYVDAAKQLEYVIERDMEEGNYDFDEDEFVDTRGFRPLARAPLEKKLLVGLEHESKRFDGEASKRFEAVVEMGDSFRQAEELMSLHRERVGPIGSKAERFIMLVDRLVPSVALKKRLTRVLHEAFCHFHVWEVYSALNADSKRVVTKTDKMEAFRLLEKSVTGLSLLDVKLLVDGDERIPKALRIRFEKVFKFLEAEQIEREVKDVLKKALVDVFRSERPSLGSEDFAGEVPPREVIDDWLMKLNYCNEAYVVFNSMDCGCDSERVADSA